MRKNRKVPSPRFAKRKRHSHSKEVSVTINKSQLADYGAFISAVATLGLLALALWTAFFSDFSKVIEENLRRQNSELKQEKDELVSEVELLADEKSNLEIEITSKSQKLEELVFEVTNKQKQAARLNREVLRKNRTIELLSSEKEGLSVQTQELETDLVEKQIALYLAQLPTNRKYNSFPTYLYNMTFSERNESMSNAIRRYAELAYTDMEGWLTDMSDEAETTPQKEAAKLIQNSFYDKCGSRSTWVNLVANVDLSSLDYIQIERDLIAEKLSNTANDRERRDIEIADLQNESDRKRDEIEFYFEHLPESVSKCFKF